MPMVALLPSKKSRTSIRELPMKENARGTELCLSPRRVSMFRTSPAASSAKFSDPNPEPVEPTEPEAETRRILEQTSGKTSFGSKTCNALFSEKPIEDCI